MKIAKRHQGRYFSPKFLKQMALQINEANFLARLAKMKFYCFQVQGCCERAIIFNSKVR